MESPNSLPSLGNDSPRAPSPLTLSIKSPTIVSYEDMKDILKEYSIFEPDIILKDDIERSVCIFVKNSIKYVLKLGNREDRDDTTKYALLKNEALIYTELQKFPTQQYFPKVYDSGDIDNEFYFILMEFIEGKSLYDYINEVFSTKNRKSDKEVLTILLNLTEALKALWSGGIVHNDLSVENIMIEPDLNVKLIDFEKSSKHIDVRLNTIGSMKYRIGYLYLLSKTLETVKDSEKYRPLINSIKKELDECEDPNCLTVYTKCANHIKTALSTASGGRKKSRRRNKRKNKTRKLI